MDVQAEVFSRGRRQLAVVASFATIFMLGVATSLLGPSLPGLAGRLRIALPQAGLFFTFLSLGSVMATLVLARWMDQPVRHALVTAGALLAGCALVFLAGSETFAQAGAAAALIGLAISTAGTAPNAIIAELYRRRRPDVERPAFQCSGAGAFAGPLLITTSIPVSVALCGGVSAGGHCPHLLWACSIQPPTTAVGATGSSGPHASLTRAATYAARDTQAGEPERADNTSDRVAAGAWLAPLIPLFLFAALYMGTEQALGGWLFTYGRQSAGLAAPAASVLTALFWLSLVAGRLAAIGILGRASNRVTLFGGVLLGAAGIAVLVLGSVFSPLLWLGAIVVGFGLGPLFPTTLALGAQLAPMRAGAVTSLVVASGSVGVMVLPYASGAVMARAGAVGSMAGLVVRWSRCCCASRLGCRIAPVNDGRNRWCVAERLLNTQGTG
jgi:fucose permease